MTVTPAAKSRSRRLLEAFAGYAMDRSASTRLLGGYPPSLA